MKIAINNAPDDIRFDEQRSCSVHVERGLMDFNEEYRHHKPIPVLLLDRFRKDGTLRKILTNTDYCSLVYPLSAKRGKIEISCVPIVKKYDVLEIYEYLYPRKIDDMEISNALKIAKVSGVSKVRFINWDDRNKKRIEHYVSIAKKHINETLKLQVEILNEE